jgi:hypothetical protein
VRNAHAGEVSDRDYQIDHLSDAELVGERYAAPRVRFSEPGYYRAKVMYQEHWGYASLRIQWRKTVNESYAPIEPRLLYAVHPGTAAGISVATGGVAAVASCSEGAVAVDDRLAGVDTVRFGVCTEPRNCVQFSL